MVTIEQLKKITPAEAYFLMYRTSLNREMMKVTLGDLIIKKSLKLEKITKHPHPSSPAIVTYKMLSKGENYSKNKHNKAEQYFIKYFAEGNKQFQLRSFAKMAAKEISKARKKYSKDYTLKSNTLKPYLNTNFLTKIWDRRNSNGKTLGKEIESFLDKKDKELVKSVKEKNQEKTASIIASLGGFIFLLKNFENKLIKEIRALLKDMEIVSKDYFDETEIIWFDDWSSFDSISSSFSDIDSSGSDFGDGGADGGSSDGGGGCSSCSGCGGCGGCS